MTCCFIPAFVSFFSPPLCHFNTTSISISAQNRTEELESKLKAAQDEQVTIVLLLTMRIETISQLYMCVFFA